MKPHCLVGGSGLGVVLLGLGLGATVMSCGGPDPYCGDGETDENEQCDDGNEDQSDFCRDCQAYLPPRTIVKWLFNADAAEGFVQDNCTDLRVSRVLVELSGPAEVSLEDACPNRQVVFDDLAPGAYTAEMTPLDVDGDALVGDAVSMQVTAESIDSEHTIVIPPEAWSGPYTGTFFFAVRWGALDCSTATPPVATQVITVTVGATVVSQTTTTGQALDGSAPGPCVPAANPTPQSALAVPFGPATIVIVGNDGGGVESFRGTFETFVGAGASNPTLTYDVPTVFDAGI